MNKKYEVFIQLLNFNNEKYPAEKVFKDFISLFAIGLSNNVIFNKENQDMYEKIYQSYDNSEQYIFYALTKRTEFCQTKHIPKHRQISSAKFLAAETPAFSQWNAFIRESFAAYSSQIFPQ